ncbi:MAG TPA: Wzy polymerase domain-containing protein [Burkholderiales bacterium]|nr:Wzy polymerase domain-containing protein [Burkholderiales bacterium]
MLLPRIIAMTTLLLCALTVFPAADEYVTAQQLYQQGKREEALKRLDARLAANPRDARARFLKGVILADQKHTQEAIKVFTELTQDFPELPEPYNNLAVLYASQGDYARARDALETAVRNYPGYTTAYENLGDVYAVLAGQAYDKAIQLDAKSTSARNKLALIRQLLPTALADGASTPLGTTSSEAANAGAGQDQRAASASPPTDRASVAPAPELQHASPPPAIAEASATDAVLKTIDNWAAVWSRGDASAYLSFYAPDFRPTTGESRPRWEASRRARLPRARGVKITVADPRVSFPDADHAVVNFRQDYVSENFQRTGRKTLHLVRLGNRWLIQREVFAER